MEENKQTEQPDMADAVQEPDSGAAAGTEAEQAEQQKQPEEQQVDPAEEWKKQAEENYNRFLRVQADFDNYRKRTRKEKEDLLKYASQPIIEALLPVLDNLERALAAGSQESASAESLMKGVEMVFRQIQQVLEQEGLKPIEAEGKPFDPQYHQAVMQEDSPGHDSGMVIQELQKGYMLKDKVIRPSMVKVST